MAMVGVLMVFMSLVKVVLFQESRFRELNQFSEIFPCCFILMKC